MPKLFFSAVRYILSNLLKYVPQIFWSVVLAAIQPTTLVSFFGPALLHLNLLLLRGNMALAEKADPGLVNSLRNLWTIAISEWEIQFYTLVLAFIVCIGQAFQLFLAFRQSNPSKERVSLVKKDPLVIVTTIVVLGVLAFGLFTAMSGIAAKEEIIAMYLPPAHDLRASEFALPPLGSPITWGRTLIFICGILVSYSARKYGVTLLASKARK